MQDEGGSRDPAGAAGHEAHEQQLAAALRDLLHEADVGAYRDSRGQPLSENRAFQRAQAVVEAFGLTHETLCRTLDECAVGTDLVAAARRLAAERQARPGDTPPEYDTWHTGP